jgi:Cobalamin adenosyltransferase
LTRPKGRPSTLTPNPRATLPPSHSSWRWSPNTLMCATSVPGVFAHSECDAVGGECNPEVIRYLNRLSDTLFILSRAVNDDPPGSESLWAPGAHGGCPTDTVA